MRAGERAILVTCALYLIVVGHGLLAQLIPPAWAVWSAIALIATVAATAGVFLRIAARRQPAEPEVDSIAVGRLNAGTLDAALALAEPVVRSQLVDELDDLNAAAPGRCTSACGEGHRYEPGCQLYLAGVEADPDATGPIPTVRVVDLDTWPSDAELAERARLAGAFEPPARHRADDRGDR